MEKRNFEIVLTLSPLPAHEKRPQSVDHYRGGIDSARTQAITIVPEIVCCRLYFGQKSNPETIRTLNNKRCQ